jgi:hypothetical protein
MCLPCDERDRTRVHDATPKKRLVAKNPEYERALSLLPRNPAEASRAFRLMRRALRVGNKDGAWLALEGLRNVSRSTGNARWNLLLCKKLVEEARDGWNLMTLATIEFELGKYALAERHMLESIALLKGTRKTDLGAFREMLAKIRSANVERDGSRVDLEK